MSHTPGSPDAIAEAARGRHPDTVANLRYFAWSHLPADLQPISAATGDLALAMVATLPDGPEMTHGLRKLLEAKDCFVRAALDIPRE